MSKKQKKNLSRIILSAVILIILQFTNFDRSVNLFLYLISYLLVGYDVLLEAFNGIKNKQAFDESLLMSIATIGAIILAIYTKSNDFVEAVSVMLFYQIGEFFQSYAVGKSRKSIADLMDIAPDYANIEDENGNIIEVDPDEVEIGSLIIIKPGEKVPLDGIVIDGESSLDTKALTGESLPKDVKKDSEIYSGSINLNGLLKVKTTKEFGESTVTKVLELIEDASERKSKSENFITKFARIYTPVVVYLALALAFLPGIFSFLMGNSPNFSSWIYRALIFLIISCPCALVISIPLSFFAGIGSASKKGILVKGSNYMEVLSNVDQIIFDKTGTLTKGTFEVTAVHPEKLSKEELLHIASHVERYSTHPIADSLRKAYPNEKDDCEIRDIKEISGYGISAKVNDDEVYLGNSKLMDKLNIEWKACEKIGTIIHLAINNEYQGHIVISDTIKENSKKAISDLKKNNISKTIMLTGDSKEVGENVAKNLSLDEFYSELLPQDKVKILEEILDKKDDVNKKIAFVGDGINDAPSLTRADVGIAMGAMGSDAAIEAADVVLMDDDPGKIPTAIKVSKKCLRIVKENIYFSIGVKIIVLILGALGLTSMWAAIFADVGVTIIAVLNAMRCMYLK
ncbi:heavy metal translocating P-type ATPase [Anaerococcus vaginalis]|uniref:heavy metal translocating P-type ATPase n=1 Tax=Anaerococcus vaginalis TaxID=33037 RepID=UPI0029060A17|nr:heavy metal translocating P-type ATPase [Anaerococcus vaginalis]MDU5342487.1 heavy metal translocating P-type ATPase [Anaerococcus vaginalis]